MSGIDAGTVYSSIRLKLDQLGKDINSAVGSMDKLSKSINDTSKATENLNRVGSKLTMGLTVPLVAASAAMVKFASDTNESLNASNVVFRDSSKTIEEWGKTAAEQAGLSAAEFYQSSAVIGAGLQNAGYSAQEAADETINLTKRAADMASIFNTDVNDALIATQSALRGEYEPARRFAITLNEAAVKAKALEMGLVKTGDELSNYAKTQARMAIIMEQTNRFAGDFVNTSDQLANSTRIGIAELKNEASVMGQQLLPIMLDIIKGAREMMARFSSLTDEQRKTILTIAALAAGIGPLAIGIGKTSEAIGVLKIAFATLGAAGGPVVITLALLAGVAIAMAKIDESAKKTAKQLKETWSLDQTATIEENTQKLANARNLVNKAYREANALSGNEAVYAKKIADEAARKYRIMEQDLEWQKQYQAGTELLARLDGEAASKAATAAEAKKKSEEDYIAARKTVLDVLQKEVSEHDKITKQIDELQRTPWAKGELEDDRLKAIELLKKKLGELTDKELEEAKKISDKNDEIREAESTRLGALQSIIDKVNRLGEAELSTGEKAQEALIREIADSTLVQEQKDELIEKTREYYALLADSQASEKFKENMMKAIDVITTLVGTILDEVKSATDTYYDEQIAAAKEAGDELLANELETEKELAAVAAENAKSLMDLGANITAFIASGGTDMAALVAGASELIKLAFQGDTEAAKEFSDRLVELTGTLLEDMGPVLEMVVELLNLAMDVLEPILNIISPMLPLITALVKIALIPLTLNLKYLVFVLESIEAALEPVLEMIRELGEAMNDFSLGKEWDKFKDFLGFERGGLVPSFQRGGIVQHFDSGGIVAGTSRTGDRVPAMLNSEEMVLTPSMQVRLLDLLNGASNITNTNNANFNIGNFFGTDAQMRELARKISPMLEFEKDRRGTKK